jgi:serine/threonine protein kinase
LLVLSMIFKPGSIFERYQVLDLIDRGYMGEVYRAIDLEAEREVALKFLRLHHLDNPDIVRRARMEALALAQLRHPNIVRVYETGVTANGMVWMSMELLRGRTLRGLLRAKAGRVPVGVALTLIEGIAEGVAAAHRHGIIHRDLKPENIFVTQGHEVRVLDLGTAKFLGYGLKTTDHLVIIGTLPYMSPEHISGQPVDVRTDVYAAGIMLYEMLAGRHPFAEQMRSALDLGAAQMFRAPPRLSTFVPEVPDFVAAIAHKAIAKRREGRFSSMTEMGSAIRAARSRYVAEGWAANEPTAGLWEQPIRHDRTEAEQVDSQAPSRPMPQRPELRAAPVSAQARASTAPLAYSPESPRMTVSVGRGSTLAGAPSPGRSALHETAPLSPVFRSARPVLPFEHAPPRARPAVSEPRATGIPSSQRVPASEHELNERGWDGEVREDDEQVSRAPAPDLPSTARTWTLPWTLQRTRARFGWSISLLAALVSAFSVTLLIVSVWTGLRDRRPAAQGSDLNPPEEARSLPVATPVQAPEPNVRTTPTQPWAVGTGTEAMRAAPGPTAPMEAVVPSSSVGQTAGHADTSKQQHPDQRQHQQKVPTSPPQGTIGAAPTSRSSTPARPSGSPKPKRLF